MSDLSLASAHRNLSIYEAFQKKYNHDIYRLVVKDRHLIVVYKPINSIFRFIEAIVDALFRGISFRQSKVKNLYEKSISCDIANSKMLSVANQLGLYRVAKKCGQVLDSIYYHHTGSYKSPRNIIMLSKSAALALSITHLVILSVCHLNPCPADIRELIIAHESGIKEYAVPIILSTFAGYELYDMFKD